jgi:prepilin-type N-terminal cleavage/methylation domain-containing protein
MNMQANRSKDGEDGFTLVEVMVAAILVAIFFASLFELNAMCLRYIDSSKESLAALQSVQDRAEALRNRAFDDLTRTTCDACTPLPAPAPPCVTILCVHDAMAIAANPAPFSQKATEVVTISNYHPPTPPTASEVTQFTRSPNGSVVTNSLRTAAVTDLVKVDVSVAWTMTVGGRARTEQTSCIVSNGTKK